MAKILIGANHYAVSSGRYMSDAFKRVGCDVRTFGTPMGNRIWGLEVDARHVWTPDASPGIPSRYDCSVKEALAAFPGWTPDLIVIMDSAFDLLGHNEDFPCPKVLYGVDNHVRNYAERNQWFDHKFLAHHDGPTLPVCDCGDMTWLPCARDKVWFPPSPIPMKERKFDLTLIGYPYTERQNLVTAMRDAGLAVFATLGALYDDYRKIYHDTKISLCSSAASDVAQRVFETAGMGCMILTDPCPDFDRLGARAFQHYVPYNSIAEAVELARDYLSEPETDLYAIANAGQEWALPHDWDSRAHTILEVMNLV